MTTANNAVKTAIKLFEGKDAILKECASIKAAGAKLDQRIQVAGLSVMNHVDKHGDVTVAGELLNTLFGSLSKGTRKLAFVEWMLAYGKVSVNMDPKTKGSLPLLFDREKTTNLDGAMQKPWYDFKPEPAVDQAFDFAKMLAVLLSKADKAAAGGKEIVGAELLSAVRNLNISNVKPSADLILGEV